MALCTAPVEGHRSASAAAKCPACRSRSRGYGSYSSYTPSYTPSHLSSSGSVGYGSTAADRASGGGRLSASSGPRWSRASSTVVYTPVQVRALTPIRESFEKRASLPGLRDVFLCHAWDDRKGAAKVLHDLLTSCGVSVWFSENDILLGAPFLREIDKGLAKSRVGIVLVTPAFLRRVEAANWSRSRRVNRVRATFTGDPYPITGLSLHVGRRSCSLCNS
jgi:TIR domain